ncbi:MAG: hypothetical protein PHZ00_00465 [Candidatus Peribacteraceae bacterium]|nr:hypothetical protein [Candidatus Peribacteraceae bacterium]
MHIYPLKAGMIMDWDTELCEGNIKYSDVDYFPSCEWGREIYTNRLFEKSLILLDEEDICVLEEELKEGCWDELPDLEKSLKAMVDYARKNPTPDGDHNFIWINI